MRRPANPLTRAGLTLAVVASLGVAIPAAAASGRSGAGVTAARPALPVQAAAVAAVPVVVNLCAKAGTKVMPDGSSVPIWGFAANPGSCGSATADLPGPLIDVNQGDTVTVNLQNDLSSPVSIVFPGQSLAPDRTGAAPGATKAYEFTASRPGTFLYEAGTDMTRQVAMGLYGALVVHPAGFPDRAYGDVSTEFDTAAVLVLSEIDPSLNNDPSGAAGCPSTQRSCHQLNYKPKYWLINGKSYNATLPVNSTAPIPANAGDRVLLRYVNAGQQNHTMMLLGMHERFIAKDAGPLGFPFDLDAETFPTGSTADAIATVPAGTAGGARFGLFNRNLHLTNGDGTSSNQVPGGMMTFITVP